MTRQRHQSLFVEIICITQDDAKTRQRNDGPCPFLLYLPPFLPSVLPSFPSLPSFLPSFLPSSLPSFLPSSLRPFLPSFPFLPPFLLLDFPHVVAVLVAVVVFACDSLQFVGVVLGIFRNDDFPKRYLPKRFVAANAFFGATRNPLRVGLYVCMYVCMYVCR